MSDITSSAKDLWNAAHYTQVKVSVCPETAAAFKAACKNSNCSMASVLSKFMEDYSQAATKSKKQANPVPSRRKRRNSVKSIIANMEQLMLEEEAYKDNIPENLQGSKWYDAAEQSISIMQEAIDLLYEIY